MTEVIQSTCENPQFPNWTWRYARNKKLSRFEPWLTRRERWPPMYRHMGLPDHFRFHPVTADEDVSVFEQLGANYAQDLVINRETGFGNAVLGHPPGPAPPRLVLYDIQNSFKTDDLYKVNEIHNVTPGMSLLNYISVSPNNNDAQKLPLNPRQYLELALYQPQAYPGTFPHFNVPVPTTSHRRPRMRGGPVEQDFYNPLKYWLEKKQDQEKIRVLEERQNRTRY